MTTPATSFASADEEALRRLTGALFDERARWRWAESKRQGLWLAELQAGTASAPAPTAALLAPTDMLRRARGARVLAYVVAADQAVSADGLAREARSLGALLDQPGKLLLVLLDADLAPAGAAEEIVARLTRARRELRGARWRNVTLSSGEGLPELRRALLAAASGASRVTLAGAFRDAGPLRAEVAEERLKRATKLGAAAGAVPLAGLDLLALVPLQIGLVREMACLHGHVVSAEQARDLIAMLGAGYLTRSGLRQLTKAVPLLGSATGAVVGSTTTYALGRVADEYFRRGLAMDADEIKRVFRQAAVGAGRYLGLRGDAKGKAGDGGSKT